MKERKIIIYYYLGFNLLTILNFLISKFLNNLIK